MRRLTQKIVLILSVLFLFVGAPLIVGAPTGRPGLVTPFGVPAAHAGANEWKNLKPTRSPEEIDAIKRAIKQMSDMGVHKGAICGILGNSSQESGFNLSIMEGDPGSNSNSIGAWGAVQLLGVRKEAFLNWTNSENGGSLKTEAQMRYIFEIEPGIAGLGDSFKQPIYYNNVAVKGAMVPHVKQYTFEEIGSIEGYKKLDDPRAASLVFEAVWERAGVGEAELSTRTESAAQICEDEELFKDLPNLQGAGNTGGGEKKDGEKKEEGDKTHDASKAGANATPKEELDLDGMEGRKAYESRRATNRAEFPTKDELSRKDQVALSRTKTSTQETKEYPMSNIIGLIIAAGVVMMLYSLILFLATVVEKGGSFIPGPWVTFTTLGKYKLAVEDDMVTNDRSVKYGGYYTSGQLYGRCVIIFVTGALLVSGSLTAAFGTIINVLQFYIH